VDDKLDMSHQCMFTAQKAKDILGCIPSSMANRGKGGDSATLLW